MVIATGGCHRIGGWNHSTSHSATSTRGTVTTPRLFSTSSKNGTYQNPGTGGPIAGEALRAYMNGLFSAFPDLSFEIVSAGLAAPDLVAAQWIMRGTNTGSMMGLPPTGRSVELPGADFIRVPGEKVRSVEGYFDSRGVPDQLGLQVIVQPRAIGPFGFGISLRAWAGATQKPGAISVTLLNARGPEAADRVRAQSRQIATELLTTEGFLGLVTATVGDRMMTITAWEDAEAPRQLMRGGQHGEAMKLFFSGEVASAGYTSVFVPERVNAMWVRCDACGKMSDHAGRQGVCPCGAALPDPVPFW